MDGHGGGSSVEVLVLDVAGIAAIRVLATQFGSYAAQLVEVERYGVTVAMVNRRVTENRLADIAGKTRNVPENCELLSVARRMGVCLG